MSKTYGWLYGRTGNSSRCGNKEIACKLATYTGFIAIKLNEENNAEVHVENLNLEINGQKMYRELKSYDTPYMIQHLLSLDKDKIPKGVTNSMLTKLSKQLLAIREHRLMTEKVKKIGKILKVEETK